ncbi:MAG: UDP-N-acetylmuramoylalanine--D-glutamate ligase [Candidatus Harrisonbacteria bacterium RIFCSPLOWO2_02_FULL_41_13b]|uniref:UDP-N-acetylmuramoylalanine--D-glutamate ligase n=1 Tax=Candidatus Harrisonbacteria bacterium RIFCSPLOWO2_02_FULL_41_13b TaxID=1798409 RepID=A0A1G1ZTV3_9BACT|nr:MAG: UDP-N-acetylmuramoylalanine--D-glutamate ligase [Candidatus Harrisonbacteria bacterium RIFCSPLOWO2_02_FULL_41_13b]
MKPSLFQTDFKGKKVLVFGLGLLGGGVATTNWLLKQGAKVTVTDLKNKKTLLQSLKKIKGRARLRLDGHKEIDIKANDIIIVNPDVSINNPFIQLAFRLGKQIENEATIFLKNWQKPTVAITGTRGKTTTTNWTNHFLKAKYESSIAGNAYDSPFLKILDKKNKLDCAALEIPSFALEFFDKTVPSSDVTVITNIYQDHLNRHSTLKDYALTKANIFKNQSSTQHLILNFDNERTKFFIKQKPKAQVWFFSDKTLPEKLNGVYISGNKVYLQNRGEKKAVLRAGGFSKVWGRHNVLNLLASSLAANLSGVSWSGIQKRIKNLPQIPFRQETIFENGRLRIINDTTATSPDGGVAAVERFASPSTTLIAGGTDRQLNYEKWARVVLKKIKKENMVLLSGSATQKMRALIGDVEVFDSLEECLRVALLKAGQYNKSVLLFSPAAKSFEKFKNEYDRGEQFNDLVGKLIKKESKIGKKKR